MDLKAGLYLLPNLLNPAGAHRDNFPACMSDMVPVLDGLIAESQKGGRRFLSRFCYPQGKSFREVPIALLNEHTTQSEMQALIEPLKRAEKWGLISDAGLPILADPGADLVSLCRKKCIPVHVLPGPSSLLYALMLSGFSAQNFAFHGYLPRRDPQLKRKLAQLEQATKCERQTQLFIEAPYRNLKLMETLLGQLQPTTYLAVCWDLTAVSQGVIVERIAKWRQISAPPIKKIPAVFLIA
ncbi:MAG: SAM-dependent methyltransferase [Chlamydiota bacterium]